MKKILFAFLFSFPIIYAPAQNYIEYQRIFNRLDNDIIFNNLDTAILRLDSVHANYDFIYAGHCIKALQICCAQSDSVRADAWLKKCFVQGVPLWIIRLHELTSKVFEYENTKKTIGMYDSLHNIYESSINKPLAKTIDSLLIIDQRYTRRVNDGFVLFRYTIYGLQWLKNNRRQFAILKNIIDSFGFPGEKLIGLSGNSTDSSKVYSYMKYRYFNISELSAYIMLIHCYSKPRQSINEELIKNVQTGNLPPYQFGGLNDFMAKYGKKKYRHNYYNVWHNDPDTSNIIAIDARRKAIGLSTFEEVERNRFMENVRRTKLTLYKTIMFER